MPQITTFRVNVRTVMITALSISSANFLNGKPPEGPMGDIRRDMAFIWPERKQREAATVVVEDMFLRLRVYKQWIQTRAPETPGHDPAALEALVELVEATINTNRTLLGPWNAWVEAVDIDMDENGIEALIVGRSNNLAESSA